MDGMDNNMQLVYLLWINTVSYTVPNIPILGKFCCSSVGCILCLACRVGVRGMLKLYVSLSSIVLPNVWLFIVTPCCFMSQWLCFDFVV